MLLKQTQMRLYIAFSGKYFMQNQFKNRRDTVFVQRAVITGFHLLKKLL